MIDHNIPREWSLVLAYLSDYPNFFFRSSTLSDKLASRGVILSSQRLSKVLLEMYETGLLQKITRGTGAHIKSFYKIKEEIDLKTHNSSDEKCQFSSIKKY